MRSVLDWVRRVWYRLRGRWYAFTWKLRETVSNPDPGSAFQQMVKIRAIEAQIIGHQDIVLTGNSIIHIGEGLFESALPVRVSAIGGDNLQTLMDRLDSNVLAYSPKLVIFDTVGNSLLTGMSADIAVTLLRTIIGRILIRSQCAWINCLPLGSSAGLPPDVAVRIDRTMIEIDKVNRRMRDVQKEMRGAFDIIPVHDHLRSVTGYIRSDYGLADKIHVSAAAYNEVYVPMISEYLKSKGYMK